MTPAGLHRLNQLTPKEAECELLACCGSRRWAAAMTAGRPYPTARALHSAADREWWALVAADWQEAFAAHPRIGDQQHADAAALAEQRSVADASPETLAALADGNREYEARFGRVFLVRAAGRSAREMLALLHRRLENDQTTELHLAAAEQATITRLRLERLLAPGA